MTVKSTLTSALAVLIVLVSCRGSKNFSASGTNDEIVYKAVKFLNKRPEDAYALGELKFNYQQAVKNHEEKINTWRNSSDIERWDKIIGELSSLQGLYDAINTSGTLLRATKAQSYFNAISVAKDSAADEYYQYGLTYIDKEGRDNMKEAYYVFKKADQYKNGFKNSRQKMKEAFDKSIINVVINPVHDDNFFANNWSNRGFGYNREYLQQTLIRDLGGDNSNSNPARFYTDWDARRKNISPDWIVDLTWQNIYVPRPVESNYSRNRTKKIEIGKDTSGRPIYQTVYATVRISRLSYNANGDMEYQVTDAKQNKSIEWNRVPASVSWQDEYATYTGDSRALDSSDWNLINNNNRGQQYNTNDEVLNELTKRVYYDIRNRLQQITAW
ncbi:MAG: hypothetical protein HYX40_11930 [Sphingobacteriales bacterium]|nr:hypothetical protein [Sphingobacteriales bacterium]